MNPWLMLSIGTSILGVTVLAAFGVVWFNASGLVAIAGSVLVLAVSIVLMGAYALTMETL